MNSPHTTKGIWTVVSNTLIHAEDGTTIIIKHATADNRGSTAQLIASAPELLTALKTAVEILKISGFKTESFDELLNKAEGRVKKK